jgi:hypothetical protein
MKRNFNAKLAIGAVTALLAAPVFAQQDSSSTMGHGNWLTRWIPPHTTMTDRVNGNDMRDNRDSTISRNDVRLDDNLASARGTNGYRSSADRSADQWHSQAPAAAQQSNMSHMSNSAPAGAALPATAVQESPAPVIVEGPAPQPVEQLAQEHETIVATPAAASSSTLNNNNNEVTAKNLSGTQAVHDTEQRDVDSPLTGPVGSPSAGREGEEHLSQ